MVTTARTPRVIIYIRQDGCELSRLIDLARGRA
jgi:hypothetical protein